MSNKGNKKTIIFLIGFSVFIFFIIGASASPSMGGESQHNSCHQDIGYSIESFNGTSIRVVAGETFTLQISATGSNLFVFFHPEASDNALFDFTSGDKVTDGSPQDLDTNPSNILAEFTIKAPEQEIVAELFICAMTTGSADWAKQKITVTIGSGTGGTFTLNVLSHYGAILGGLAVGCLAVGTILYERDREKYTKTHGYLASSSLVLTTINLLFIVVPTINFLGVFTSNPDITMYGHVLHIVAGAVGLTAGTIAFITGISGIRAKAPGYIALITWTFCYIYGIVNWGLLL